VGALVGSGIEIGVGVFETQLAVTTIQKTEKRIGRDFILSKP